ncbi:hypothetical protein [Virgibacillus sp. YIM 98842]|uniref:hypothetical protein n=1 Tax=Virgibacillus sp. YIM 98842 TaxID=2663533 RepID=UPI0013DBB675|nr:hypothetical protein [Virgibacillus sp. YIM 98842]
MFSTRKALNNLSETVPFVPWPKEVSAAITIIGKREGNKYWLQDSSTEKKVSSLLDDGEDTNL